MSSAGGFIDHLQFFSHLSAHHQFKPEEVISDIHGGDNPYFRNRMCFLYLTPIQVHGNYKKPSVNRFIADVIL